MNTTVKTATLRMSLLLCIALLFQGCTAHSPARPVDYPAPVTTKQPKKQSIQKTETVATIQAPKQSSAAANFSRQATKQSQQGNYDLAASILERGLRVAPKDAMLWSQLAEVKLRQQQYQQARSLATKSNSLAGPNSAVVEKNRRIIQEAQKKGSGQ